MNESGQTQKLLKELNAIPGCYARKRHGGAYCSGEPDAQACYKGQMFQIEVKLLGGELSDLQAVMLQRWQDAGAVCVLAVWDPVQKAFAFFAHKNWQEYVGKVKRHVIECANKGEYFNVRIGKEGGSMLKDAINGLYSDSYTY